MGSPDIRRFFCRYTGERIEGPGIWLTELLGYLEFLHLTMTARLGPHRQRRIAGRNHRPRCALHHHAR